MDPTSKLRFTLNGRATTLDIEPGRTLLQVLREDLALTGTKQACDSEGECGACTVLLDGRAVRSCLTPMEKVRDRSVVTIEGLGTPQHLHPLQQAFIDHGAVQCGYCTPGMLIAAAALLESEPDPSRDQIVEALEGNLCRCTGYAQIVEAVEAAATVLRGESRPIRDDRLVVGGSQSRVDAVDKVTGRAKYVEDIRMPGLLHVVLVRSPHPHARVVRIDAAGAERFNGVIQILTAADIPGENSLEGYSRGEHLLASVGSTVRMIGDALALVVGTSREAAEKGAGAVRIEYDLLPHTYDAAEAKSPASEPLYPGGNVLSSHQISSNEIGVALSDADRVIQTRYETTFMEHSALERETVLGYLDDEDRVTVVGGHQEPHWARGWIATMLGSAEDGVRVITPPIGGAFGGKQDPWPLMAVALAAYHVGKPVLLAYSREESFDASPKRHPYQMDYRLGAKVDGTLTGLKLRIVANTGAYDCDGYHIPRYALVAGGGPYHWQSVDARAWSVHTNAAKAGQMRGFGTPQSTFGLECTLDELACQLGIDPLELRIKNAIDDETTTFLGYPAAETLGYRQCLEAVRSHYDLARSLAADLNRDPAHRHRRGVGLAGFWYRFGKRGPVSSEAHSELGLDGTITLYFAAPDYGQGTATVMAQLAAEALGVPRDSLHLVNADTASTPDSGIQGASRSTYWVGGAVSRAAELLRERIQSTAAEMLDIEPGAIRLSAVDAIAPDGRQVTLASLASEMERIGLSRRVRGVFAPDLDWIPPGREPPEYLPFFVTGAHLAEVDVDMDTGQVEVVRITAAHDVGKAINPQSIRGQVEGAILMSLGATLMEEYLPGLSRGFGDYYLPTIRSAPEMEVILVEVPSRWGPHGAKGLGEAATLPTTPAVINAIYDASGGRVRQLPATSERVLSAIHASLPQRDGFVI